MLSLSDRDWKEFRLLDYFDFIKGNQNDMASLTTGNVPLVSAKKIDNGYKCFVSNNGKKTAFNGHCITINNDGDGGAGIAYYQPANMLLDTHVTALYPKENYDENILLFWVNCITVQREKFGHGYSLNNARLSVFRVMLPIDENELPDFVFMQEYIAERKRQIIQKYIDHIGNNIQIGGGTTPLNKKKWAEFELTAIFDISPGKRLTKSDMHPGNKPFIGATDSNNGVTAFTSSTNASEDCNVLGVNYNGSVVENFFHPYTCLFSDDVKRFRTKQVAGNKYIYLFLKTVILQQKAKYTYGYKFNEQRMRKQILLLPVNEAGEPDWAYMEEYGKHLFAKLELQYLQEKQLIPA